VKSRKRQKNEILFDINKLDYSKVMIDLPFAHAGLHVRKPN
jgi:hypothetical protein